MENKNNYDSDNESIEDDKCYCNSNCECSCNDSNKNDFIPNIKTSVDMNTNSPYTLQEFINKTKEKINSTIDESMKSYKNILKSMVSRDKCRFDHEGFDLDLTYITERIIAMGFPSNNIEKFYRNNLSDVKKFFEKRHPNKYKVYNLCSERTYPGNTFFQQSHFPFDDHEAPPICLFLPLCKDIDEWLSRDSENIVAIHCKAGKGRTGTMICAYLLYAKILSSADDALRFYGQMRTVNGRGVTIPSQLRYVYYFEQILNFSIPHPLISPTLLISKIKIFTIPNNRCKPYFKIENGTTNYSYAKNNKLVTYTNEAFIELKLNNFSISGDVKFSFFHKKTIGKKKLFSLWFNTYFVPNNGIYSIKKSMIDKAHKDKSNKIFDRSFKIEIHYLILDQNFKVVDLSKTEQDEIIKHLKI